MIDACTMQNIRCRKNTNEYIIKYINSLEPKVKFYNGRTATNNSSIII